MIISKKTIVGILLTIIIIALIPFGVKFIPKQNTAKPNGIPEKNQQQQSLLGVWISFYELNFKNLSETQFKNKIDTMFNNIAQLGLNTVFCHVRPSADAYYPSKFFPFSSYITGTQGKDPGYDPLKFMIESAHQKGLSFHAWINPYRIASSISSPQQLSENNFARIWLSDESSENDCNVIVIDKPDSDQKSYYFNPASLEVQKLINNGIKEILDNYAVDGIHFDDYFYPSTDPIIDSVSYEKYQSNSVFPLPLEDWRRANVSCLLSAVHRLCRERNKIFGVSPSAHISTDKTDKNYCEQYADILSWLSTEGYIDYIAPQLYFGYEYPTEKFRFENLLNQWNCINRNQNIKLYIGLASYKIGTHDAGSAEWLEKDDILARQFSDALKNSADGIILYSYSSLFSENKLNQTQRENLKKSF
ncbi:MAG: family 10 glycosylhydrolase [bacterium]|nr:family 10 glycosylhydrolase [bacterium]